MKNMSKQTTKHPQANSGQKSECQSNQAVMLEEVLRQPGTPEVMKVCEGWRSADRGLDAYREATKNPMIISTTDHTNA